MSFHYHPCRDCGTRVECDGDLERNYDGFPETICRQYHKPGGTYAEWFCAGCAWKREAAEREAPLTQQ